MYNTLYKDKTELYYKHNRPEMLRFIPDGIKTVLDIGCGMGNFGHLLKETRNITVWGIEPDETSAGIAKTKLDFVINDVFNAATAAGITQKFDVITFNDVLEHLIEPEQALKDCRALLNPGGVIIASIPNARFYTVLQGLFFDKDFKYQNEGPLDKTHLRFFTKKSMLRLFAEAGLTIINTEGINHEKIASRKMKLLKLFLPNYLNDINVLQYAIIARFK